jgi:hypothetical protein
MKECTKSVPSRKPNEVLIFKNLVPRPLNSPILTTFYVISHIHMYWGVCKHPQISNNKNIYIYIYFFFMGLNDLPETFFAP